MSHFITIVQLESAINESRSVAPPVNGVLSADLRAMADLYGRMIYKKAATADLYAQSEHIRAAVLKWLQIVQERTTAPEACPYRPGDPAADSCEACQ